MAAKKFKYTTEPLKISPAEVQHTALLHATAFHFLATPEEIKNQIPELLDHRATSGTKNKPLLVWEPFPAGCKTQNRDLVMEACKLVDIFSPNHLEMTALFENDPPSGFEPDKIEIYARALLDSGVGPRKAGYVVIRAAEHGCFVAGGAEAPAWFPAFYATGAPKVIDPTGAGNAFLGGFTIGFQKSRNISEAACFANVAASFALEQIGLPSRETCEGKELWNGEEVSARLSEYRAKHSVHDIM